MENEKKCRYLSTFAEDGVEGTSAVAPAPVVPTETSIPASALPHLLRAQAEFQRAEALRAAAPPPPPPPPPPAAEEEEVEVEAEDEEVEESRSPSPNTDDQDAEEIAAQAVYARIQGLEKQIKHERRLRETAQQEARVVQAHQVAAARGLDQAFFGYIQGKSASELLASIETAVSKQNEFKARQGASIPADPAATALAAQAAAALEGRPLPEINAPGAHAPAAAPLGTTPQPTILDAIPQLTSMSAVRNGNYAANRDQMLASIRAAAGGPSGQWSFNNQVALSPNQHQPIPYQGQMQGTRSAPATRDVGGAQVPTFQAPAPVAERAQVQTNPGSPTARQAALAAVAAARGRSPQTQG